MDEEFLDGAEIDSTTNDEGTSVKKSNSNFAKVIAQRNEYMQKAKEVDNLKTEIAELKEMISGKILQDEKKIEQIAKEKEIDLYFAQNPNIAEFKEDIKATQTKYGMSIEEAKTFVLAQKNPSMLDKQMQNRVTNNEPTLGGHSNVQVHTKDPTEMTGEELELWWKEQASKGF